jgi:hypothetical protein
MAKVSKYTFCLKSKIIQMLKLDKMFKLMY